MYNLKDIHGRKVLTGIDESGKEWKQFETDYYRNQNLDTCTECGLELEYGWVQVKDSNIKVCDTEVQYDSKRSYYFLDEEQEGWFPGCESFFSI